MSKQLQNEWEVIQNFEVEGFIKEICEKVLFI